MASTSQTAAVRPATSITGRGGLVDKYFYLAMGLLAAIVVIAGFGRTINNNLIHPAVPRPLILWFHSSVFLGWVLFYIFQSALVRTRNVKLHRSLGWFGAALGAAMVPLGIATAIAMTRFETLILHVTGRAQFMIVPFYSMAAFGTLLTLAILRRKKRELHRRLLFVATAGLLTAAFGRLFGLNMIFVCVDTVMLMGVAHDLLVNKRIHNAYLIALPCVFVAQIFAIYTWKSASPWWMAIAHSILG